MEVLQQWSSSGSIGDEMFVGGQHLRRLTAVEEMEQRTMHSCIGALLFKTCVNGVSRDAYGTGFLISPDLVLTCAHNLHDKTTHSTNSDFVFYPGACGLLNDPHSVSQFRYLQPEIEQAFRSTDPAYLSLKSVHYDYALLRLEQPVLLEDYLALGVHFLRRDDCQDMELSIFGYPFDNYQTDVAQLLAWQGGLRRSNSIKGSLSRLEKQRKLEYEISTAWGQSGAPVVAEAEREARVVAIHKAGHLRTNSNIGRLITMDLLCVLARWQEQMGGESFRAYDMLTNTEIPEDALRLMESSFALDTDRAEMQLDQLTEFFDSLGPCCLPPHRRQDFYGLIDNLRDVLDRAKDHNSLFSEILEQQHQKKVLRQSNIGMAKRMRLLRRSSEIKKKSLLAKIGQLQTMTKRSFEWDLSTCYAQNFSFEGRKVTLLANNGQQVTGVHPLPHKPTTFRFKVHHYGGDPIIMGILTEARKDEMFSDGGHDSFGYICDPDIEKGLTLLDGQLKTDYNSCLFVEEGHTLTMEVDLSKLQITFRNACNSWKYCLPSQYSEKAVFVFATMSGRGGCVEIIE